VTPADADPVLAIFARRPAPGGAKTRLIPALGEARTALLAECLIDWTVSNVLDHWPGSACLFAWPPESVSYFQGRFDLAVYAQEGADLGARMLAAMGHGRANPCAVMGCDVPHASGEILRAAHGLLRDGRNVIGPASDGGFYLIGVSEPVPDRLFDGIEWGGAHVCARLFDNAGREGVEFDRLPVLRDLDGPEDLRPVAGAYPALAEFLRSDRRAGK
jgi:rSAM/selenodomain-associated transferase 1